MLTMCGMFLVNMVYFFFELTSALPQCDMTTGIELDEGNMGQSSDFNWLGILQVFLNNGDDMEVAVTGIVLIKASRALASADPIVRIPKRIFQHDTRAMFLSDGDVAVNYSLVSFVTHPEYQSETVNSIAILLLNIDDDNKLVPICFPIVSFDTSHLYLAGFTDENEKLEKKIYRIQYTDRPACEEFYEKEGLIVENRQPISYLCGKGQSSNKRCVWDNGMALVSNSSGWFTLIGLSIHGPGCTAPARFISLLHYSAWISNVTRDRDDQDDDYDYISPGFRRTDALDTEFIPIHRTFTALRENGTNGSYETNRSETDQSAKTDKSTEASTTWPVGVINKYTKWPFPVHTLEHFYIMPSADDEDVLWITPFNETFEKPQDACSNKLKQLLYAEDFMLKTTPGMTGTVTYKLSLYDLILLRCSCVTLEMECTNRTKAFLEFREVFEYSPIFGSPTPEEILQASVVTERGQQLKKDDGSGTNPYMRPEFIKSAAPYKGKQLSYDLSIRFTFNTKALMKFKMFSSDNKTSAPTTRRVFKKKNKFPRKKMNYWGSIRTFDKSVKAAALVVDHELVLDTVSDACRTHVTPDVVIIGCLLIGACSTLIHSVCQ